MAITALGRRKTRAAGTTANEEHEPLPAPLKWSLWIIGAGLWLFFAAAMLSFDSSDAPSHAVAVHNGITQNLGGSVGAFAAYWTYHLLGIGAWILMGGAAAWLVCSVRNSAVTHPILRCIGLVVAAVSFSGFHALFFPEAGSMAGSPAGLLAHATVDGLLSRIGGLGTFLVLSVAILVGLIVAMDEFMFSLPGRCWNLLSRIRRPRIAMPDLRGLWAGPERLFRRNVEDEEVEYEDGEEGDEYEDEEEEEEEEYEYEDEEEEPKPAKKRSKGDLRRKIARLPLKLGSRKKVATDEDLDRDEKYEGYQFPSVQLLSDPESNFTEKAEASVRRQAELLEEALDTYGIDGEVEGINSGPTVTLFSVQLAPGTKVQALTRISSDVARSLSVQNIRIVPNMAGKTTVGIEVPNLKREQVRLKELISSGLDRGMVLPMFLGKDASGEPIVEDLSKMPHMLIAGTTGSGKSICLNTIIMSWLFMKRPDEVKLILVDPKMVELSIFGEIPHLACPVVTEMGRAAAILEWAVGKMEERYDLFREAQVRDISAYNALTEQEREEIFQPENEMERAKIPQKLPYIVFIIDELADLILTHKDIEQSIVRIAQKARAVGIHLILATQRPQANVVTGLIKSNMPCRLSFRVASGMDSRIVLDGKGAELLLGLGDMMYVTPLNPEISRAQGTFVSDKESRKVVRFLKDIAAPSFERSLIQIRPSSMGKTGASPEDRDSLFDQAVRIIIETGRGSVSLLQRRMSIGYSRASRLVDQMTMAGILGDHKGSVAREVLLSLEEWEQMQEAEGSGTAKVEYDDDPDGLDEPVPSEYANEYRD